MDILIYGCTGLTMALAPPLAQAGHQLTIIDPDADKLALLKTVAQVDAIVAAEPLMHDYLQEGDIDKTGALLALSEDDHKNALVAQIAHHIFNVPRVLCFLQDPALQQFYRELGIAVADAGPAFVASAREFVEQ